MQFDTSAAPVHHYIDGIRYTTINTGGKKGRRRSIEISVNGMPAAFAEISVNGDYWTLRTLDGLPRAAIYVADTNSPDKWAVEQFHGYSL